MPNPIQVVSIDGTTPATLTGNGGELIQTNWIATADNLASIQGSITPQVQSDYAKTDISAVDYIKNKPDLQPIAIDTNITDDNGNLTALSLTTSALSHLDGGAIIENLSVTTTSLGPALEVTGSYTSLDGGAITSSGNGDLTILGQHPTPMPANAGINTFYAGMNLYGDDALVSVILDADCFYGNPLRVNAGGTDVFSVDNSGNVIAGIVHINDGAVTASQLNVDALDVVNASSLDNGNITTSGSGVLTATGLVATPTNTASLSPVEGQICVDNSVPGNSRLVIWLNGIWNTVSITAG